jgi:hypothetical protein
MAMSQRQRARSRLGVNDSSIAVTNLVERNLDEPNVVMKIEQMILEGFGPSDRYRIGDSVQNELERIFTEQGVSWTINKSIEIETLDGGEFATTRPIRARSVGNQLAQSVYQGITRIGSDDQSASSSSAKITTGEDRKR